jgi:cation diffusion facilitator family transporter
MPDSDSTGAAACGDGTDYHIQDSQTGSSAPVNEADRQRDVRYSGQDASRIPLEQYEENRVGDSADDLVWTHGDLDETDELIDENVTDTSSVAFKRRIISQRDEQLSPAEKLYRNLTIVAAVMAGVCVAIVKFVAAAFTGSTAMISEGIHSLVDAANDSLMLIGKRGSKRKPDVEHPFGYGRFLYFYTFIVSVVILLFGGGFTILQGVLSLRDGGHDLGDPFVAYVALGLGVVLEGISLTIAFRDVNKRREDRGLWEYIRHSKSPTSFTVLLEDMAAVLGMVFAFVGIALSVALGDPVYDSIASILIGVLMASFAIVLVRETTSLLIGEGLSRDEIEAVVFIVEEDPSVIKCGRVLSMYMGPADLVLNLDVTFDDELDEGDILQAIDRLEAELIDDFPQCSAIFIEAESLNQVYRQRYDRRLAFQEAEED